MWGCKPKRSNHTSRIYPQSIESSVEFVVTRVSFVIPLYNKAPFITGVLSAIDAQTGGFEREIIVIDDGSTDGGFEHARESLAGMPGARLFRQPNQGPAIATNHGVAAASGDVVKLVDADDLLVADGAAVLLDAMIQRDLDLVLGDFEEFDGPPDLTARDRAGAAFIPHDDPLETVIGRGLARTSHTLFKRDAFLSAGGCDPGVFAQDHSLFLNLCLRGRLGQLRGVICLAPREAPGRIMDNQAQLTHDSSLAIARFLDRNRTGLTAAHIRLGKKKVLGRIAKWRRRERGAGPFDRSARLNLWNRLGGRVSPETLIELCSLVAEGRSVRLAPAAIIPPEEVPL